MRFSQIPVVSLLQPTDRPGHRPVAHRWRQCQRADAQQVQIREIERGLAASTFADEVQVIRQLASDWNGQLWVVRAGPDLGKTGPIDLITPTGTYLGTLTGQDLPDAFGPGGLAAYIGADANGAVVIRVKRVEIR